ncbi:MAG: 16S rRNA (adenine(1518)-N(6)/adenine(1519)-N(6))-dimethyltransferase RsmA [Myxococcota bacterium]
MTRPPLDARSQLGRAGLRPKKSWGQNFLAEGSVHAAIVDALGATPNETVVELGAGLGALTYFLLERGARVIAVERDRELIPLLSENLAAFDRCEVLEADAAKLDYEGLKARVGRPLVVVGNLPYQLSSRILVSIAAAADSVQRVVVLVQREVAERLAATPGGRTRGLLSVLVQRRFDAQLIKVVAPGAFYPRPQVHSAVVRLVRHARTVSPQEDQAVVEVARAAFSSRRKSLRNAMSLRFGREKTDRWLERTGIDPRRRAETLELDEWSALARACLDGGEF